jgi:hypothetical protein
MAKSVLMVATLQPNSPLPIARSLILAAVAVSSHVSIPKPALLTRKLTAFQAPPETQVQCDAGKAPAAGFAIASDGTLSYNSSDTFYACPATDTEYNIYITPNFGQKKCFSVQLTASGCGAAPSTSSSSPPSSPPQTQTVTTLQTVWQTITSTTTGSCSTTTSSIWTNSSSSVYSSPTKNVTCPCETEKGYSSSSSTSDWWHSTTYQGYILPTTLASN